MEVRAESLSSALGDYVRPSSLLTLLAAYFVSVVIYRLFFHPLRKIPGPFVARFTELWRTRRYFLGNWHDDILDLHRKYGPVVRLSPNEVSFIDKDALLAVYGHTKSTKKTSWYDTWKLPGVTNSFFHSTDPKEHSFLRKRVSATYSMTSVLSLEHRIQQVADILWSRFGDIARKGEAIDLDKWASFFAFDVVGELALGGPFGFVEAGFDPEHIIPAIHGFFYFGANMGYLPLQTKVITHPIVQRLAGLLGSDVGGSTYFNSWLAKQIHRRRERGPPKEGEKSDMLDHFISMKTPDGRPAEDKDVLVEMGNIVGAGADTTSIGIRTVLGQLMLHKDSYARVQKEVDRAYTDHGFSDEPGVGNITFAVASELPFLAACVKEALRLHPSILWQLPREAPPQGVTVKGHYIPGGSTVSISPLSQNRCPEVYGKDADEWRPERWIVGEGSSEQQVREMNKFDTTFGYGARTCIGKHLALVEIHKFIAQFLHQFDVELVNKDRPWVTKSMWFSYQAEMFVRIKERST